MRKFWKNGYTLTEIVVVLVILAIAAAAAIPSAIAYGRLSEFRKNEANAKTAYLAAESALTWYRASGEWEAFRREVLHDGVRNDTFGAGEEKKKDRIYAVTLNSSRAQEQTASGELVRRLLADSSYDKDFLNAAIAIEIDVWTGQVYSVFYGTRCQGLAYDGADADGILSISAASDGRGYDNRRERLLGYYSMEDVTNVAELKPARMKVTEIHLVNSETLSLNWSGNSRHGNLDVDYEIRFYRDEDDAELFSTIVNWYDLRAAGANENQTARLVLKDADGNILGGNSAVWAFPFQYQATESGNGRFSLVLDAMMSAQLYETLSAKQGQPAVAREYDTGITRLGDVVSPLAEPQDIYATVQARPTYENTEGDFREYRLSSPLRSNSENTLFASVKQTDSVTEAGITRFRHLSNIRLADGARETVFALTGRNMDWSSSGTGYYDLAEEDADRKILRWCGSGETGAVFPSIPLLAPAHTLQGGGSGTGISNLKLGAASAAGDDLINMLYGSQWRLSCTEYLGLFREVEGTVQNLTFKSPSFVLDAEEDFSHLRGAGIVCGRSQGIIKNVSIRAAGSVNILDVKFAHRESAEEKEPAGIGGFAGVVAGKSADGSLYRLTDPDKTIMEGLEAEGAVAGLLPVPEVSGENTEEQAADYPYGTGGIFGYAFTGGGVKIADCKNHAGVKGNLFTGGIGGRMTGSYGTVSGTGPDAGETAAADQADSGITDCENDGLILCTVNRKKEEQQLEGRYFGGILGYGQNVQIAGAVSASGRSENFRYTAEQRNLLTGQYVGGILGYGSTCRLVGCSTKKGGYILGSDYVGGIAGGLSNDTDEVITGTESVRVTTNAGYVIGNCYVGGIVGKNDGEEAIVTIRNCVNNGVAAGYGRYIGGIAGYNGEMGVLSDCAGYLSDYDGSVYRMIVSEWKAAGDCVGGLAGYNNGRIESDSENQDIAVRSVSSVVAGRHYVGGVIGFNDTEGELEVSYPLIGGRIYASGNGAGGCIGLNASEKVLGEELVIRPGSVRGNYYVGGCIGANVVDIAQDVTMDGFQADNMLGSITGNAFTGGLIGYHRTYTSGQLTGEDGNVRPLREYLLPGSGDASGTDAGDDSLFPAQDSTSGEDQNALSGSLLLLPVPGDGNIPTPVMESANRHLFTVTDRRNTDGSLGFSISNIPVSAGLYAGGIVGYCETGSRLLLKNCRNAGNISKLSGELEDVVLSEYLSREGIAPEGEPVNAKVSFAGGIIGVNRKNQVIDHCASTGSMNGFTGLGGIVGFNTGGIFNCSLEDNYGSAAPDYTGGIAGLNFAEDTQTRAYTDVTGRNRQYTSGTIADCRTQAGRTISGKNYVGGIVGLNMTGGVLTDNRNEAAIVASGNYAGGIAGANAGIIEAAEDQSAAVRTVSGMNGEGTGGIAGWNQAQGVVTVRGAGTGEIIATGPSVSIAGREKVGGIIGIHEGSLRTLGGYLTAQAASVRALDGYAGGIAGEAKGPVERARNRCAAVMADRGPAGGIVAVNGAEVTLTECENLGGVSSDQGYAGGITAENYGIVTNCTVKGENGTQVRIRSQGVKETGAVCAVNHGSIEGGAVSGDTVLSGEAAVFGGIAGCNRGTIEKVHTFSMPGVEAAGKDLSVGGIAGVNEAVIRASEAEGLKFEKFSGYRYLGGIAGENREQAAVEDCSFRKGVIAEGRSAAGNCYGGIAGINSGTLLGCSLEELQMEIRGVYTATSTGTAAQKESLSSHAGGIAGKNEESGSIVRCYISGRAGGQLTAGAGMAGGITGYNKGTITLSGDEGTDNLMTEAGEPVTEVTVLQRRASEAGFAADDGYVSWSSAKELEEFRYSTGGKVSGDRSFTMILSTNGSLGGITAYNAPTGSVNHCATGNWYLNNKSDAIGVGTGGIIGMNESQMDLSFLVNRAFVGRQLKKPDTNRFAGGIIGNQNNTTARGFSIRGCINYGTVYCLGTHYSGGILGQWTGVGGSILKCRNYGNLQTTYGTGWVGASGGIVAQLYHAYGGNEYNIISCGNYGNIYGREGKKSADCANDSAGILGNITAYEAGADSAQNFTVQLLDCVNGSGVEIYSASMASGIVGFLSCDNPKNQGQIANATGNIRLRIERCRNFASVLAGGGGNLFVGGIFGERYGERGARNTVIRNCYSVNPIQTGNYRNRNYPIISYTANSGNAALIDAGENYFLCDQASGGNGNQVNGYNGFDLLTSRTYTVTSSDHLLRAGAAAVYRIDCGGESYVAAIQNGKITDTGALRVEKDSVYSGNNRIGSVLFPIRQDIEPGALYNNLGAVIGTGGKFDEHARASYYKVEDRAYSLQEGTGEAQMREPDHVALTTKDGRLSISVTPASGTDPFAYVADLYLKKADGTAETVMENITFYTEEYSTELPQAGEGGDYYLVLRAQSMFEEILPSEAVISSDGPDERELLPDPQIVLELDKNGDDDYLYRLRLVNTADFADCENPEICVKFMNGIPQVRGAVDTDGYFGTLQLTGPSLQQLTVQAVSTDSRWLPSAEISVPVYLPAYEPAVTLAEQPGTGKAVPHAGVSGTSLRDLSITATLDASGSGNVTTPTVYRADLTGTIEKDGKTVEAVLESADILTASGGAASVTFDNLPEYITGAGDLKIRVWYAMSGLGPVYTYYPAAEDAANIRILSLNETIIGEETESFAGPDRFSWEYAYSPVLEGGRLSSCVYTSGVLFQWLPRPVLMAAENGLEPEYDENQHLSYTFGWDQDDGAYQEGNEYLVSLTGIRGADRISLVTDRPVSGNTLTVDAENWSYETVELSVTRKGDAAAGRIGLTSVQKYPVGQRLPVPAQPSVENRDVNELCYTVTFGPVSPETGCVSYGIFLQPYGADGTPEVPVLLETAAVDEKTENGVYEKTLNLEEYEGRRVQIYIVAQAAEQDRQYVSSRNGVTYELTIPTRIRTPEAGWRKSWEYDTGQPVTVSGFEAMDGVGGSLTIQVVPQNPESIPPGDSSYLLKAYIFETKEQALAAKSVMDPGAVFTAEEQTGQNETSGVAADGPDMSEMSFSRAQSVPETGQITEEAGLVTEEAEDTRMEVMTDTGQSTEENAGSPELAGWTVAGRAAAPDGLLAVYPAADAEGIQMPVQMGADGSGGYSHTLAGLSVRFAGKWILCYTRISSGNGQISSKWVANEEIWRLPYVRLQNPAVSMDNEERPCTVTGGANPDLPQEETWTADRIVLRWNGTQPADAYEVKLTPKDGQQSVKTYRIVEDAGTGSVRIFLRTQTADGTLLLEEQAGTVEDGKTIFELPDYGAMHQGSYTLAGISYFYQVDLNARLEVTWEENTGFSYALVLPDAESLTTANGVVLSDAAWRVTASAGFCADVTENAPDGSAVSEAYLRSEETVLLPGD